MNKASYNKFPSHIIQDITRKPKTIAERITVIYFIVGAMCALSFTLGVLTSSFVWIK